MWNQHRGRDETDVRGKKMQKFSEKGLVDIG